MDGELRGAGLANPRAAAQPRVWLCVLSVLVCALFAGDHGANEIFTMNEAA